MNLTIVLPDAETRALQAKAAAHGITAEQYARQVIERDLAPAWLRDSWSTAEANGVTQLSSDEIAAEIAAARLARRALDPQS